MTIDLSALPIDPVRGRNVRFVVDDHEVTAHYLIYQTYDPATTMLQVDQLVLECKIRGLDLSDDENPFIDIAFEYLDEFDHAEYRPLLEEQFTFRKNEPTVARLSELLEKAVRAAIVANT